MESIKSAYEGNFLSEAATKVRQRLASLGTLKTVPSGTVLFREGDYHDHFYVVQSGAVILEMCLPGRGCTRLLTIGPGEMLAWSSVVGESQMTATAIAQGDVELLCFSGKALAEVCESDHECGYYLMRWLATALSKRLFATRLQLLDMFMADSAPRRN